MSEASPVRQVCERSPAEIHIVRGRVILPTHVGRNYQLFVDMDTITAAQLCARPNLPT